MVKNILKGENLRRVFFAFLKENNAFYNYKDAFNNFHSSRSKEIMKNTSFGYFLNRCSDIDCPTELIGSAFFWSDTKEGISYWSSLHYKFAKFCSQIKEEECEKNEGKKNY